MGIEGIENLIRSYVDKNPEGIFVNGEFDLDVNVPTGNGFSLWFDGDTHVVISISVGKENAELIQKAVRGLGREVIHTWSQQYGVNP